MKVELTLHESNIAGKIYIDQDGCVWREIDTAGYLDENLCTECSKDVSWTLLCLDGGEAYCNDCLNKLYEVQWR